MCGIAGFIDYNMGEDEGVLKAMIGCLNHRGPDDQGWEFLSTSYARIAIGHRRLSIIDLSPTGHQPMHLGPWSIVFNGEIYNYIEIRNELEKTGHTFTSNSDTAVILAAFRQWDVMAVHRFVGMFAFFLVNRETNKCYLFRDRVGVKPVYYSTKQSAFIFGSELKALMRFPGFDKELDMHAIVEFFQYGYISATRSIFAKTKKLLPGHYLEIDITTRSYEDHVYWQLSDHITKPNLKITEVEAISETEAVLKKACDYRMVADVPVGLFLSGGYDSSIVAALLQKDRTNRLKTFTIGFENQDYNEAGFAGKVAEYLSTDHTEYICNEQEAKNIIPLIARYYDEPFGDSSAIPTMLVSKIARQSVTVALSADGGDEVFGGYTRYTRALKKLRQLQKIPSPQTVSKIINFIRPDKVPFLKSGYRFDHYYYALHNLLSAGVSIERLYSLSTQYLNDKEISELVARKMGNNFAHHYPNSQLHPLVYMMARDFTSYLPDDILVKVDRATMAYSLEGREPLLDHNVIEFAARLQTDLKVKKGKKKYLLKEIAHRHIPRELLDRPKRGFAIPIKDWLRKDLKPLVDHYLSEPMLKEHSLFNVQSIGEKKKLFFEGRNDHFEFLWFLLIFQMWYESWILDK